MTRHVLIVAGSDSSGGAGLSRDIETLAAFGLRSAVAITAITAQTDQAVRQISPVAPKLVAGQMRAAFESTPIAAIKIGMLATEEIIDAVSSVIAEHSGIPVVLDPVLASSSGQELLAPHGLTLLRQRLLPLCRIVTPNLPELAILTGEEETQSERQILYQGEKLLDAGPAVVLVKGGHARGDFSTDFLLGKNCPMRRFDAPRLPAAMRGTGCMLASAIAAGLARAACVEECVVKAKQFVFERLSQAH